MVIMATKETHQVMIDKLVEQAINNGGITDEKYHLIIESQDLIEVRETETGKLVAFSAMRSDFEQSLQEFIEDYML